MNEQKKRAYIEQQLLRVQEVVKCDRLTAIRALRFGQAMIQQDYLAFLKNPLESLASARQLILGLESDDKYLIQMANDEFNVDISEDAELLEAERENEIWKDPQ